LGFSGSKSYSGNVWAVCFNTVLRPAREFFTQFARYNGKGMHFLKINNFLSIWLYMLTISIHVQNIFLSTATKQMRASKFDFQTYTQVGVVAKKNTTKNVEYPIHADSHHHCRHHIRLYLNAYSVPLCFDSAFTLFVEQSEFARLRAERFWNCQTERTFMVA
jgi:hypothetical protein